MEKLGLYWEKEGERGTVSFKAYTRKVKSEGEKLHLYLTPLLDRYAILGSTAKISWDETIIPCRIVGKSQKEIILSISQDALSLGKIKISITKKPPLVFLKMGNLLRPFEMTDMSEDSFTVRVTGYHVIEELTDKTIRFRMILDEHEQIEGEAWLMSLLEDGEGRLKASLSMVPDGEGKAKVRDYLHKTVRKLLLG
ncbi:MAG: hypothetical protein KNN13_06925 [Hydrogenobacter thermophilus]|uniref:hypothetical protein n=1 Tax=Hydrogenobacter thermophilus TaxID=940 RepID=UPI001C7942FE|nr:hypothetical protein [Hydrogenobacter thermophilus]QWK19230.1 MAG: hypothetical protein KNN13_06925 [Hydrogenobacter thermophilus]